MREETKTVKIYTYDELDSNAKTKALDALAEWLTEDDWWDVVYMDAEAIGLKIESFDTSYHWKIEIELVEHIHDVCRLILAEHGPDTDTYRLAVKTLADIANTRAEFEENSSELEDALEDIEREFLQAIGEEYLLMSDQEYDFQTSEAVLVETIQANGYEFYADGSIV